MTEFEFWIQPLKTIEHKILYFGFFIYKISEDCLSHDGVQIIVKDDALFLLHFTYIYTNLVQSQYYHSNMEIFNQKAYSIWSRCYSKFSSH